jgi:hypothetical protein
MVANVTTSPRFLTPARRRAMLDRAAAKSAEQVAANNLPRELRRNAHERVWAVASRTEAGVIWLVTEADDGEIGYHAAPARPRLLVDARLLSGRA